MSNYLYQHELPDLTIRQLKALDEIGWHRVFERVLSGLSIPYNIDFTERRRDVRLCELYDIVWTYRLQSHPYQTALVRLTTEYWGNEFQAEAIYALIRTIDYVRPSAFFNSLLPLVTKPEYSVMIGTEAPDKFSLLFHLMNAIMVFDTDRKLMAFLYALSDKPQRTEYYQVSIRYFYSNCGQAEFNSFLAAISEALQNKTICSFVLEALKEAVFYQREMSLLCNWLDTALDENYAKKTLLGLHDLAKLIAGWQKGARKKLSSYRGFQELEWLLILFVGSTRRLSPEDLDSIVLVPPESMYHKSKLLERLGYKYSDVLVDFSNKEIIWPDDQLISFGNRLSDAIIFHNGTLRGKRARAPEQKQLAISDGLIQKSIDDSD